MKQIVIAIIITVATLSTVSAQSPFIVNEWGEPQPFSLNVPYWDKIRPDTLAPNYVTGCYNNDSLLWVYNDPDSIMIKRGIKCGMPIDTIHYSFKKMATHFDVGHGDIWLLKVTSPTSAGLAVKFEKFILPDGALISSYRIKQTGRFLSEPKTYDKNNFNGFHYGCFADGKEIYIEYYQPKSIVDSFDISIKCIVYDFTDGIRATMPELPKKKDEPTLKSGSWGWSTIADNCGTKIPCSGTEDWETDGKSVVFIFIRTSDNSSYYGTGFFVNKGTGYSVTSQPYIITAGYLFTNSNNQDLRNNIESENVYVNYEDQTCDDSFERRGIGGFNIITVGDSFNQSGQSGYIVNEDFALLQSERMVTQLAVHNVLYAGWDRSFNYEGNSGYAYIGHPNSDVKSVNTYSGYGEEDSQGRYFKIYNSTGINETGFSGSPVFCGNSAFGSVEAVGWAVQTGTGSFTCGDENQVTQCGMFSALFSNIVIQNNLNPTLKFSQPSSQPTVAALPSHCTNCVQDGDETGIDCGGSCQPCGMADDLYVTSTADIFGKVNINARFQMSIDGDASPVEFKSQSYNLTAGESVLLKNFKVYDNSTFNVHVDNEMKYSPAQGCQPECVDMANFFTPNGDGLFDYFTAYLSYVERYSIEIKDRWNNTIFSTNNIPVFENGVTSLWDGSGAEDNEVYFVFLTVKDCYGDQTLYTQNLSCFKSVHLEPDDDVPGIDMDDISLLLYPNPVSGELSVSVNKDLLGGEYELEFVDLNGKSLNKCFVTGHTNTFDVTGYIPGIYIIIAKIEDKVYTKKFSKE